MLGVSTFSQRIWEAYGRQFLDQVDMWPGRWVIYLENGVDYSHPNITFKSLYEIDGVMNFLTNLKNLPKAHGVTENGYNYNFDIFKFCRKMFAQFDAFNEGGKVFWLDSDLRFRKPVTNEFLSSLFNEEHLFFLGRKGFYTESGFVGFDTDHVEFNNFSERYRNTLRQGIVFRLRHWQDCVCFDWAREGKGNNLTPDWTPKDGLDVMSQSVLDEYMTHFKGNRKKELMT